MACEPYQVSAGDEVKIDYPTWGIPEIVAVSVVGEHGIYGYWDKDGEKRTHFFNFDEVSVIPKESDKARINKLERDVAALKEIVGLLVEGSPETAKEKFWGLLS